MPKRTVLVPVDGSEFSRHILPHVTQFCRPAEHQLLLLQVTQLRRDMSSVVMPPVSSEEFEYDRSDRVRAAINEELEALADELRRDGYTVTTEIRVGEPRDEIIRAVEHGNVDLVALATHGRTGVSRLVLGSVAEHLIRHLSVPIFLVRPFERPVEPDEADEHTQKE